MAYIRVTLYIYTNDLRFTLHSAFAFVFAIVFPELGTLHSICHKFWIETSLKTHTQKGNTMQHKTRHKQHEVNDKGACKGTEKDKETKTKRRR